MAAVQSFAAPASWQINPARVGHLGVWCGDRLYIVEHHDPRFKPVELFAEWPPARADSGLADIARMAFASGCGAVWLLPTEGTRPGAQDPHWMQLFPTYARLAMASSQQMYESHELSANKGTALAGLVFQRRGLRGIGEGLPLGIYATWIDAWPVLGALAGVREPERRVQHLATGLALAAFSLAVQLRFSPSYTGIVVLRETLSEKAYAIPPLSEWARELLEPLLPGPMQWYRPPREARALVQAYASGAGRLNVYAYDRTASYVASAREVPVGDPVPTDRYMPGLPGVYRLSAEAPNHWYGPGFFHVGEGAGGYPRAALDVWAWEPQIRAALAWHWPVLVEEGYYWPKAQKHDLLRAWQQRVWNARCAAQQFPGPAGVLAARICKRVGVATIGRFRQRRGHFLVSMEQAAINGWHVKSHDLDARGKLTGLVEVTGDLTRTDLLWPHVWATVIANANERLQDAIARYAARDTIGAYVDALYTLWPHEPLEGVAGEGPRLGKFRREYRHTIARSQVGELDSIDNGQAFVKWLAHHRRGMPDEEAAAGDMGEWDEEDEGE